MLFGIEAVIRPPRHRPGRPLVQLYPHRACHVFLRLVDQGLQHFPLRRKPKAIVYQFRIARHDAVFQMASTCIERDLFDPAMRFQQDGAAGGLIRPARFHPHKAVFHQV